MSKIMERRGAAKLVRLESWVIDIFGRKKKCYVVGQVSMSA